MGCCASRQKVKPIKKTTYIKKKIVIKNRWKMYRLIAYGNYGMVFDAIDLESPNQDHYALKSEELISKGDRGRLPHENAILTDLMRFNKRRHFPYVYDYGTWESGKEKDKYFQYIVMTLLGPSLVDLAAVCPRLAFSPATVACIGLQVSEALQSMHEIGYLHRDIKPANLTCGRPPNTHEIFLVDFGLSRKFKDKNGQLLKPRVKAPFRGTCPYASVNVHREKEHGPMDDLWSMLYSLIDLRMGSLPWGDLTDPDEAAKVKRKIIPRQWLIDVEPGYLALYEYLTSLYYDIVPNYAYVKLLFNDMMTKLKVTPRTPLDWEPGSTYFDKYYRQNIDNIFVS